jgi:hypothetical protein
MRRDPEVSQIEENLGILQKIRDRLRAPLVVVGKRSQSRLLVGKIREHGVQVRHMQDFAGARIQIHGVQLGVVFTGRVESANQLANPGAIEIRDIAKIQQNPAVTVLE